MKRTNKRAKKRILTNPPTLAVINCWSEPVTIEFMTEEELTQRLDEQYWGEVEFVSRDTQVVGERPAPELVNTITMLLIVPIKSLVVPQPQSVVTKWCVELPL